jgi:hypothetical protein
MIKIYDEDMEMFGRKINSNTYEYDNKTYRLFASHQVEKICYYVEVQNEGID